MTNEEKLEVLKTHVVVDMTCISIDENRLEGLSQQILALDEL
jgi:hypothetical protein